MSLHASAHVEKLPVEHPLTIAWIPPEHSQYPDMSPVTSASQATSEVGSLIPFAMQSAVSLHETQVSEAVDAKPSRHSHENASPVPAAQKVVDASQP